MKRLIKKSELYNTITYVNKNNYDNFTNYEIFKNPTDKEINDIKQLDYNGIRGVIQDDGDVYIWIGDIFHNEINNRIRIDVDGFRFAYDHNGWEFNTHKKYTLLQTYQSILNNKLILSKIGNLNNRMDIGITIDIDKNDFLFEDGLKDLEQYLDNDTSDKQKITAETSQSRRRNHQEINMLPHTPFYPGFYIKNEENEKDEEKEKNIEK